MFTSFWELFITNFHLVHNLFTTVLWLVCDLFITFSWFFHHLVMSCSSYSRFVTDLFLTCSLLAHFLFMIFFFTISSLFCKFTNLFEQLYLRYFSWLWITFLTQLHLNYFTLLPLNYFTLSTSLEVLHFSHLQSFEFTKSINLNRLAVLSLAQLSPSLFCLFFPQFLRHLLFL